VFNSDLQTEYNSDLQIEYPFIKKKAVFWTTGYNKCASTFNMAYGGQSEITSHLSSNKQKCADTADKSAALFTPLFKQDNIGYL
jgi:hypothetical protein